MSSFSSRLMITSLAVTMLFFCIPTRVYSQPACKNSCGATPVQYPFGTGAGCGSPLFERYVTCDPQQQALTFTTHTGTYPVQFVDYANQVLYLQDPSMSTCAAAVPSAGFSLDWDAPFAFLSGSVFALLACSPPTNSSSSAAADPPLCDDDDSPLCSLLYSSCPAVRAAEPASTCCVYAPATLGPSYEIDPKKLGCASYAGIYSFGGEEGDPRRWQFGVAVRYRFSADGGFPSACADCERSNGACGYALGALGGAFACNCPNGVNTTSDCFFMASYNSGCSRHITTSRHLQMGFLLIFSFLWAASMEDFLGRVS